MKAHLLVFDTTQIDKNVIRDTLDGVATIENWTLFFGNTMCLASEEDAQMLSKRIRSAFPELQFLISTINPDQKGGFLPRELWKFMNDPVPFRERTDA